MKLPTFPQFESASRAQGFDEFFGHRSGCIDSYSHVFYWQGPPVR